MAYPTFTRLESYESAQTHRVGISLSRSISGLPRLKVKGGAHHLDLRLHYPSMTTGDLALLDAAYSEDFASSFSYPSLFTGSSHTVKYAGPPSVVQRAPSLFVVDVSLVELMAAALTGTVGAYPSFGFQAGSRFVPVGGTVVSIAASGMAQQWQPHHADLYGTFELAHVLTNAQVTTLLTHLDVNIGESFTLNGFIGQNYTVAYGPNPVSFNQISSTHARARVRLEKVAIPPPQLLTEALEDIQLQDGDQLLTEQG